MQALKKDHPTPERENLVHFYKNESNADAFNSMKNQKARRRSNRLTIGLYIIITLTSFWLKQAFPAWVLGNSVFDDSLFRRLAEFLFNGQWLGPYDKLTLAKGMFYPFFIAFSTGIGVPLKLVEHGFYLGASLLAARYVGRKSASPLLGVLLFSVLAFNPVVWAPSLARVIREAIYLSLALLVVVLTVSIAFPREDKQTTAFRRLLHAALTGLVLGAFWLTREEGVWVLPALCTVIFLALLRGAIAWHASRKLNNAVSLFNLVAIRVVVPLMVAIAGFTLATGTVRVLNLYNYGVFELTEFQGSNFQRAYGAIARIKHDNWERFVVFPKDARLRAYEVSGAARELRPSLDGPSGEGWRQVGCNQTQANNCTEVLSGWFMWALRDAVAAAGHYKNARDTAHFYDQLANEINAACDSGRISCTAPRATLAPIFRWSYVPDALKVSVGVARIMFRSSDDQIEFGSPESQASDSQLAYFQSMVGTVSPIHNTAFFRVAGWTAARGGPPVVTLRDAQGKDAKINFGNADDVERASPGLDALRFDTTLPSPISEARLLIKKGDFSEEVALHEGDVFDSPKATVFIDSIRKIDITPDRERQNIQKTIARAVQLFYAKVGPALIVIAGIGFIIGIPGFVREDRFAALFVLASASLVAICTRIVLLSYMEVTSMPAVNLLYVSPASPFVLLFFVLGTYIGLGTVKAWWSRPQS